MAAATKDRNTARKYDERYLADDISIAASTTVFNGTIAARNASGELRPAADVAGLVVLGVAPATYVNALGVAAKAVPPAKVRAGVYKFATTGGFAITAADIGSNCFILDDQTVVRTGGTVNAIVAGKVEAIDPDGGIWVAVNL